MKRSTLVLVVVAGVYLAGLPTYYTIETVGLVDPAAAHARQIGLVLFVAWLAIAAFAGYRALVSDEEALQLLRRQLRMLRRRRHLLIDARQRDSGTRAIELMLYGRTSTKAGLLRSLNPKIYVVDDSAAPTELVPLAVDPPPAYDRWPLHEGVIGLAFDENDIENPLVITGPQLATATSSLSSLDQRTRFGHLTLVAAIVIRDADDRPMGVLSCSSAQTNPLFGTERREAMKVLAADLGIMLRLVR